MPPKIGITLCDPAGIGSEITAKMLTCEDVHSMCIPIVIGDTKTVKQGFDIIKSNAEFEIIENIDESLLPDKLLHERLIQEINLIK